MEYYTLLTKTGIKKIVDSEVNGTPLVLSTFAVGDGGDSAYEPTEEQTQLLNETYRNNIARIYADNNYSNRLVIECASEVSLPSFVSFPNQLDKIGRKCQTKS